MNLISIRGVYKKFEDVPGEHLSVLEDIHLEIHEGEFLIFLGPSGSGKSSLLRILSGLDTQFGGKIEFGAGITHQDMGFVFQSFALLPWLTVYENIEMGLIARGVEPKSRHARVTAELETFKLTKFASHRPKDLSGGMRQRVGIARALVTNPKILFMDEPFSELDSFTAEELRHELLDIWKERKMTIVMVSHLVPEAIELADRIAVFTPLPGRIEHIFDNTLPRPRPMRSVDVFALEDKLYAAVKR